MRAAFAALLVAVPIHGEEPVWSVRAELLVVQLPLREVIRLEPRLRGSKVGAVIEEIQAKIAGGEAQLIAAPVIWARDGERTFSETVEEVRYSTEYNPPHAQGFFAPPGAAARAAPNFADVLIPNAERLSRPTLDVPNTYETRNAGHALEMEARVDKDTRTIELAVFAHDVSFTGMRRILKTPAHANDALFAQPEFRTLKTTTAITMGSGEWVLLNRSLLTADRCELFFLRATAVPPLP